MIDEAKNHPNSLVNKSMASPSIPGRDGKAIRRRPGKQMVEGKGFRLTNEVHYIHTRLLPSHSGHRHCSSASPVLYETGDAWLLNHPINSPAKRPATATPNPST